LEVDAALAVRGVTHRYAAAAVLQDVDLTVTAGEVHALVGENGAGKSTLIKIIGGAVKPTAGTVTLGGTALPLGDPLATRRAGVSLVYQEFTLVPELSVADNIFLGRERGGVWLARGDMIDAARRRLAGLDLAIDPRVRVGTLGVAQQQMIEIARALEADARVLILDEPTASLSGREVDRLLTLVRTLRDRGLAIIYVSHRFDEIFALADRVTVLRDGRRVETTTIGETSRERLIRAMVGRDLAEEYPTRDAAIGRPVLQLERLSSGSRFRDVSLTVRAGEIVGLAGLVGAGRSSLGLAVAGALRSTGSIRVNGEVLAPRSPADALDRGVAYVTEDRKGRGLFPLLAAATNITLTSLREWVRAGWLNVSRERAAAAATARDFDVRARSLDQPAATLSGGNQQKLILARFLRSPRVVAILDEPTRGVDVGARAEIYALIHRLTAKGLGVLMISSDLPEILGMSDRVVVMRQGAVSGELTRADATPERVMALATHA
jgi:ribose transport system ATP-binding protein